MPNDDDQPRDEGRLSGREAGELVDHLADLSQAGLPLASGLKLLADELDNGRLARTLRAISADVERGRPLEEAIAALGKKVPAHVAGLLLAGARTGRLGEALGTLAEHRQTHAERWRRVRLAVAYPLLVALMLAPMTLVLAWWIVPVFVEVYSEFELALPQATIAHLWFLRYGVPLLIVGPWVVAGVMLLMRTVFGGHLLGSLWWELPLVGPLWRWTALSDWCRTLSALLDYKLPLPGALSASADVLRDAVLRDVTEGVASRIESGGALSEGVDADRAFPQMLTPLLAWGERNRCLSEALDIAADMYDEQSDMQVELIKAVLPPVVFLFVAGFGMLTMGALLRPLLQLIRSLT